MAIQPIIFVTRSLQITPHRLHAAGLRGPQEIVEYMLLLLNTCHANNYHSTQLQVQTHKRLKRTLIWALGNTVMASARGKPFLTATKRQLHGDK